ncbi:MAG: preprotein translocase subunit SecG [Pseudomonadota bacterium]
MWTTLVIIHVLVGLALIFIVLLQTGKGADMGAAFGGSSQTLFGGAGPGTFLGKMTTVAAIIFMCTSLSLAYLSSGRTSGSVMTETSRPVQQPAVPSGPSPLTPGPLMPRQTNPSGPVGQAQQPPVANK